MGASFIQWAFCIVILTSNVRCIREKETSIITANGGYVEVIYYAPLDMSGLRLDAVNYKYIDGNGCIGVDNPGLSLPCSSEKLNEKEYKLKVEIREPQTHIWMGWRLGGLPDNFYFTEFFFPNDIWNKDNKYCLQPDQALPLVRYEKGKDFIDIICTKYLPHCLTSGVLSIRDDNNNQLCGSGSSGAIGAICDEKEIDSNTMEYSWRVHRKTTGPYYPVQYVLCTTTDSFIQFKIYWNRTDPDIPTATTSSTDPDIPTGTTSSTGSASSAGSTTSSGSTISQGSTSSSGPTSSPDNSCPVQPDDGCFDEEDEEFFC